jgi:hypothetical protein
MSKTKAPAVRWVVLLLALFALTLAFPAAADPPPCPPGWSEGAIPVEDARNDNNGNTLVCTKSVNGSGNHGDGTTTKDDVHSPDLPTG